MINMLYGQDCKSIIVIGANGRGLNKAFTDYWRDRINSDWCSSDIDYGDNRNSKKLYKVSDFYSNYTYIWHRAKFCVTSGNKFKTKHRAGVPTAGVYGICDTDEVRYDPAYPKNTGDRFSCYLKWK